MSDQEQSQLTGENPGGPDDPPGDEGPDADDPNGDGPDANGPGDGGEMPFEEAIEELETIVEELEDGELPLEEAMERFERGLGLVNTCRSKLERAELKVEELLEDGQTREIEE